MKKEVSNWDGVLQISGDYPVRAIREDLETGDVDLFIDVSNQSININLGSFESLGFSRIQLPQVRGILIRYCKTVQHGNATIHFLRNIDLYSHIMNFEVNCSEVMIFVKSSKDSVELSLEKREAFKISI